jgi:hypothetical protein
LLGRDDFVAACDQALKRFRGYVLHGFTKRKRTPTSWKVRELLSPSV